MRVLLATLAAALALAAPAQAVVGGTPVPPGNFEYVANVHVMGAFGCTGTLIAPQWVVTAGHCGSSTGSLSQGLVPSPAAWPPEAYEVVLRSVYADGRGGETHAVSDVIVEPDYTVGNGAGNDVTLMKLAVPASVAPMRIAAVGERSIWKPGALTTVAGFGMTSEDAESGPEQMHSTTVPVTTDEYCAAAYPDGVGSSATASAFDARTMVCAGYPEGGRDTCGGDSGGPLLGTLRGGGLRLVAATSFGDGCGRKGKPGVYARLAEGPLRDWVHSVEPAAFAPEPAATKPKPKTKRKRCAKPRLRGKTRKQRAKAKKRYRVCKRRAARRR